jgi:hypothetical protein
MKEKNLLLCFVDVGNTKVWANLKNLKYNPWDKDICWIPLGVHKACNRKIYAIGFEEKGWAFYKICNILINKIQEGNFFWDFDGWDTNKNSYKIVFFPLINRFSEKRFQSIHNL